MENAPLTVWFPTIATSFAIHLRYQILELPLIVKIAIGVLFVSALVAWLGFILKGNHDA
jgi:hypothetical protein